ncbi:MAG: hypothetical protein AMS25_04400 [Gemmatimonas sp. SM23_52]|nr:MAG: hypothetical protein AMS25_04400 [Gemmatimonas sp. SM23_52]
MGIGPLDQSDDPLEAAVACAEAGADELLFVGLGTSLETLTALSRRIARAVSIPFAVKLEPATVAEAGQLLEVGASRVAIQRAALKEPDFIADLTRTLGCEALAVAITAGGEAENWRVFASREGGPTEWDAITWACVAEAQGAGELIVESRSGGQHGEPFDLDLLAAVSAAVARPVVAAGEAREIEDLFDALMIGNANAVVVGQLVSSGRCTVHEVKVWLAEHGLPVQLDS